MKTRAKRDELTVGAGHDGAWVCCRYQRYSRGLHAAVFGRHGEQWHSGNFKFDTTMGIYTSPDLRANMPSRSQIAGADSIRLLRRAPLKMNELREIDIMDGWTKAQPPRPTQVTDDQT